MCQISLIQIFIIRRPRTCWHKHGICYYGLPNGTIEGELEQIDADGAYDTRQAYAVAAARETRLVVPPRENAVPWEKDHPRNAVLEQVAQRGMAEWKKESGYHRRSIAENAMYRLKQLFGDSLASRLIETQVTEVHTRIAALNVMTYLGMPVSVRVGTILS